MLRAAVLSLVGTACVLSGSVMASSTVITTVAPQSSLDASYPYFTELLEQILQVTAPSHGPYELHFADIAMTQARALREVAQGNIIQVYWAGTNSDRERDLQAIPIPLLKGLLGYRIPVIRTADVGKWAEIQNVEDLQSLVACQGDSWPDSDILEAAGLPVERISSFAVMYTMLAGRRCDYFPRGIHEVFPELAEARLERPELVAFTDLIIYYPFPMYFFVPLDRADLAQRLTSGLELLIESGWFEYNLRQHPTLQDVHAMRGWSNAHIIELPNDFLSDTININDAKYWITPEQFRSGTW
ncbi:hypothetical protein NFC81_11380 [Salinispirillum sp. LH 10-3-1]|uniref:Amino acid ABC transporter substrate-binding protein n=1 Tax=Salinispirillum sp. LH 10-3-1 TaxID=2952525 RepID=A0AB38YE01_9GAMM